MIIRSKTLKQWFEYNLKDYADDIANGGCGGGFPGITYYTDTVQLYERFRDEIWELACNEAEDMGCANVYEFMAGFNKDFMPSDYQTHANQMVWYAIETYAREKEYA
jgi:hypothetical protein